MQARQTVNAIVEASARILKKQGMVGEPQMRWLCWLVPALQSVPLFS